MNLFKIANKNIFCFLFLSLLWNNRARSQEFSASIALGINAAQIDGDDLAGYDQLGLSAGIVSAYKLRPGQDLVLEILYNQSGSKSSIGFGTPPGVESIDLNYIEIPVLYKLKDWYIEDEGYYKVFADFGLSYGRLFTSNFENSYFEEFQGDFGKTKLGFLLGAGYRFEKHWGLNFRYSRAVTKLYDNKQFLVRPLREYFLTFRLEYHL